MTTSRAPAPTLLTTREAAQYLGRSVFTLEKRRSQGLPPVFTRQNGRIFYSVEALDDFIGKSHNLDDVPVDALIQRLVSAAPVLSSEQRSRLACLVGGA